MIRRRLPEKHITKLISTLLNRSSPSINVSAVNFFFFLSLQSCVYYYPMFYLLNLLALQLKSSTEIIIYSLNLFTLCIFADFSNSTRFIAEGDVKIDPVSQFTKLNFCHLGKTNKIAVCKLRGTSIRKNDIVNTLGIDYISCSTIMITLCIF